MLLQNDQNAYIANNIFLTNHQNIQLVTGPNASGIQFVRFEFDRKNKFYKNGDVDRHFGTIGLLCPRKRIT